MKFNPADLNRHQSHDLLADCLTPRPIAFVSTVGEGGVYNLAPFSYVTPMCNCPMIVGFGIGRKGKGQKKDTLLNIEFAKEFVINIVTESLAEAMAKTAKAYPAEVDEFKEAGLTPVSAERVKPPMVAESPINMECRLTRILDFGVFPDCNDFVIGEVVRIHVKDEFMADRRVQPLKLQSIGRLGGPATTYCRTTDIFKIRLDG
ncbi:MAG: flavin reductase family protein [Desulfobacterales bacterium]|nr:flavin reductase family protein [Desulfobacterales bacterium]